MNQESIFKVQNEINSLLKIFQNDIHIQSLFKYLFSKKLKMISKNTKKNLLESKVKLTI